MTALESKLYHSGDRLAAKALLQELAARRCACATPSGGDFSEVLRMLARQSYQVAREVHEMNVGANDQIEARRE